MNPDEELEPEVAPRAYYHQPVWKRIVVIGAGPAMNFLIAFAILFVLAFSIKEATSQIGTIEKDSPADGKLEKGDTITASSFGAGASSFGAGASSFGAGASSLGAGASSVSAPRPRPRSVVGRGRLLGCVSPETGASTVGAGSR